MAGDARLSVHPTRGERRRDDGLYKGGPETGAMGWLGGDVAGIDEALDTVIVAELMDPPNSSERSSPRSSGRMDTATGTRATVGSKTCPGATPRFDLKLTPRSLKNTVEKRVIV